ncbi:MAG: hypothetical protein DMF63_14275 [Acidobacteria bacterium]|nr:MAG: hypothetical protein DMF63_14275 [Acidobacteriota bacterium]
MSDLLQNLKDTEYQGVKELADAAERFLREAGPVHTKGTVAEYPNERTVRYYISSGLLTSSTEKRGLKSVFGYEHLLKLLTIKKLQADGLPISVIKDLLSDKSIEDLEKLFGEEIRVFTEREALESFRQATGHIDDSEVMEMSLGDIEAAEIDPPEAPKSKAREYLESLLMKPKAPREDESQILFSHALTTPQARRTTPKQPEPPAEPGTWKRYEVAPGLELHARDDFRPPRDTGVLMQLLERILRKLDSK